MTLVAWARIPECLSQCLEKPNSCFDCYPYVDYLRSLFTVIDLDEQYASLNSLFETRHYPHLFEEVPADLYSIPGFEGETVDFYFASPTYAPTILYGFGNTVLGHKPEERRYYDTGVKAEWERPTKYAARLDYLMQKGTADHSGLQAGLVLTNDGYVGTGEGVDTPPYLAALFRLLPQLLL